MDNLKSIGIILAITAIVVGSGVFLIKKTAPPQVKSTANAKAQTQDSEYDWGNISYDGSIAAKEFVIQNTGTETLKLTNIKTSCTCTKAQINIDGQTSPFFSMHAQSGWVGEVAPGKTATLQVLFDQRFHGPSGVGPVSRKVTVDTNDASQPQITFSLKGTVIK